MERQITEIRQKLSGFIDIGDEASGRIQALKTFDKNGNRLVVGIPKRNYEDLAHLAPIFPLSAIYR